MTTNPDSTITSLIHTLNDSATINQSGTKSTNSNSFNDTCLLINGTNLNTGVIDPSGIFGAQGLIPFNEAKRRVNDKNLTQSELYTLYVNRDIITLLNISFGSLYSDLSTSPIGRASLNCGLTDISNISNVINVNNFKFFTDINYVRRHFPNLLNPASQTSLTHSNQTVLNRYLYNNMFPNTSNKKKYSYFANKRTQTTTRLIPQQIIGNKTSNTCNTIIRLRSRQG
tara:strand:+ start:2734 stop:3414 length:681 start_codon:yes stop_codon:yes gene_type:complete